MITHADHPHGKVILFRTSAPPASPGPGPVPLSLPIEIDAQEFRRGDRIDLRAWAGKPRSTVHFLLEAGSTG